MRLKFIKRQSRSKRALLVVAAFMASTTSSSWATGTNGQYEGFCEASAAAVTTSNRFAVASDDYDQILLFDRGQPVPAARFQTSDVSDIEAAARIGNTIFWLTSHSVNSDGEDKKKRKVLFATSINPDGSLSNTGRVYRNLRADIAAALGRSEPRILSQLNIEGMADTPDAHLLVGLRAPETMPGDKAILLEVANPQQLIDDGVGPAKITRTVTLDLSDGPGTAGRGIRDLTRIGNLYLIVAGPEPDGGDPPPKIFWWDGVTEHRPTHGPDADFSGMTPEALIAWGDHEADIFFDNGGALIDGAPCDDKKPAAGAYFPSANLKF